MDRTQIFYPFLSLFPLTHFKFFTAFLLSISFTPLSLSSSPLLLLLLLLPSECTARWRWLAWHCRRGDSQEQAGGGTATSGRRLGFGQLGSARYGRIHAVPAAVDEEEEEIVGSGPATILSATAATAGSAASAATHSRQLDPCSHLQ